MFTSIFYCTGNTPHSENVRDVLDMDEAGYIKVDARFRCLFSSQKALAYPKHSDYVFAIGDCCTTPNLLKKFSYNALKSAEYLGELLITVADGKDGSKLKDFDDKNQPFAVIVNLGTAFI